MKHAAPNAYPTKRLVLLAFTVSLLLFGSSLLLPGLKALFVAEAPAEVGAARGRTRQFTLLFYDTVGGFTGAVVLTTDTATGRAQAVGYPSTAIVTYDDAPTTLGAVFDNHGDTAAAAALAHRTGQETEGPLTLSVSGVAALLVELKEYLPLTLPQAVGDLPAGEVTLTPMQAADVLRFREWETGAHGQALAHAQVVAAILNRYLTTGRDLQAEFSALTAVCDTPLNISHYAAAAEGLAMLAAANNGSLCTATAEPY